MEPFPHTPYDVETVRKDFPILQRMMRRKALTYLDSAATTLKPRTVIDAVSSYYGEYSANIHRAVYELSELASAAYEKTREQVGEFFNVPEDYSVVFTSGSTDAINLVANGWSSFLKKDAQIILNAMEHHSNLVPWQMLAKHQKVPIRYLSLTDDASIDLQHLSELLDAPTSLVALTGMSNVTGYLPPLAEICQMLKARGAASLIDGAQLASHVPVNIEELACDFFVCSAHKLYGPTGIGCLIARNEYLESLPPLRYGGGMISEVGDFHTSFAALPHRFEGGTPHIAGVIGFEAALSYLMSQSLPAVNAHEDTLLTMLRTGLSECPYVQVLGPQHPLSAVCSFVVDGIHAHDIGSALDSQGVAVRTGHHCAQLLMKHFQTSSTVRASFGMYNTMQDIEVFLEALEKAYRLFQ